MLRCGRLFVRDGGTQKANPNGEGLSNIRELEPWQAVAGEEHFARQVPTDNVTSEHGLDSFLGGLLRPHVAHDPGG